MKLQIVTTKIVEGDTTPKNQFIITMEPEEADCILDDIQNGDYASTQILNELLTEALRLVPSEYMKERAG
jgi:hypothetical protein